MHDDDLPNAVNEAIISGFSHPAQRALLTPYVERYFADVADVWERRTSERAQPVVIGLFPAWAVDKATVDAADAWLADETHPPALRRLVSEGRAGIVRALAAREFDRSATGGDPDGLIPPIGALCRAICDVWHTSVWRQCPRRET